MSQLEMISTLYYRGTLQSCNYNCPYCHFRLNLNPKKEIEEDQKALLRFCEKVPSLGQNLTLVLTPYGEALIHNYYHEAMSNLAALENVSYVACQTNLSFHVPEFISTIKHSKEKIALWCSYHPSQVDMETFLEKCMLLHKDGILFCVVAVGDMNYIDKIQQLRSLLPKDVSLFLNKMEGKRIPYTSLEIEALLQIDPFFELELSSFSSDPSLCHAGRESIMVNAKGDLFACHISRSHLGNLYQDDLTSLVSCKAKYCNCYLAYCHRCDIHVSKLFFHYLPFRILPKRSAIFFDIDGTLLDEQGNLPTEHEAAIQRMAHDRYVFLFTSLPFSYAKKTLHHIWSDISGGVFAEGADIRFFPTSYRYLVPLDEYVLQMAANYGKIRIYRSQDILYKITILGCHTPNIKNTRFVTENNVTGIVNQSASKLAGILILCKVCFLSRQDVTVVGNSINDVPALSYFTHSFAVPSADAAAKEVSSTVCGIADIP